MIEASIKLRATFQTSSLLIALHKDLVFLAVDDRIDMCNLDGHVKKVLVKKKTFRLLVLFSLLSLCLLVSL